MTRPVERQAGAAWVLLAPALLAIGAFFVVPVAAALVLSLTDFDIYALADSENLRVVGLDNYAHLLADPTFRRALANTTYFVVLAAPLSIGVSLGAALLVNSRLTRLRTLFQTILFLPVVTTLVAAAVVWRYLYNPRFGLVNQALRWVGIGPIDWLGDPAWAMPAIVLMTVWKNFGFNMVIFIAGLQAIPTRLYEAASIDGARPWSVFRHVTLPMLAPTFVFVGVMTMIGDFQLFAEPYVMTQGGPGDSTLSVVLFMFREGFRWWNLGYAAAIAFVLFAIIVGLSALVLWLRRRPWRDLAGDLRNPSALLDASDA